MNEHDINIAKTEALSVLRNIPTQSFICLPMSATFYALLKDNHNIDAKLVTGNLTFKGQYVFKQDYSLMTGDHSEFKLWAGHSWVEIDGYVWDLSFFRSLYSEQFISPYKSQLINLFGKGRGFLAIAGYCIPETEIYYEPVDYLTDEMATGIIQGYQSMLN